MASRYRRGRRGFRAKRNTSWLRSQTGAGISEISGVLDNVVPEASGILYDFSPGAADADLASRFGNGTWTVERLLGCFAIGAGATGSGLVMVCFGIGLIGSRTGVAPASGAVDLSDYPSALAKDAPWMMRVCCFLNLEDFQVEKCEFDIKRSRRLDENSVLFWSVASPDLNTTPADLVRFRGDMRLLLSERGSRV